MPKVSEAHLEARREQIVDAAVECFSRDGFHRTTMQDIIAQSGLSAGAIYRYFASKDAIIEAIADERHALERELIQAARARGEPQAVLRTLARTFFRSLTSARERKRRRLGVQVWAEALHNPRILRMVRRGVDEPCAMLAAIIRDAQTRGAASPKLDPDAAATAMIALFQGFVLRQTWEPQTPVEPYLALLETVLDALAAGSPSSVIR